MKRETSRIRFMFRKALLIVAGIIGCMLLLGTVSLVAGAIYGGLYFFLFEHGARHWSGYGSSEGCIYGLMGGVCGSILVGILLQTRLRRHAWWIGGVSSGAIGISLFLRDDAASTPQSVIGPGLHHSLLFIGLPVCVGLLAGVAIGGLWLQNRWAAYGFAAGVIAFIGSAMEFPNRLSGIPDILMLILPGVAGALLGWIVSVAIRRVRARSRSRRITLISPVSWDGSRS